MTKVYFVRHAQPDYNHADDRTRPLTKEGILDSELVLKTLKDKQIDVFYSSPYRRCMDTIRHAAKFYKMPVLTDERLRERESGVHGNNREMFRKRWADRRYHEDGGESIDMVQRRNIEALNEILTKHNGKNIVIGTHGTALSSILNHYRPEFGCDDFLRIIDWMPYIIQLDFEGLQFISAFEHAYIEKEFPPK